MRPEELFKAEGSGIPEEVGEDVSTTKEDAPKKEKIDIFHKDLTIKDLLDFLKQNNFPSDPKVVEKYYEEIIINNRDKELITETIKELDRQKETLIQQIEKEPDNRILLKRMQDMEDKISDLNTSERIKEDNVKNIVREISKTIQQEAKPTEISEINPQEAKPTEISEINLQESNIAEALVINPEEIKNPVPSDNINKAPDQKFENVKKVDGEMEENNNPLENVYSEESEKISDGFKNIEKNEALDEIKKNNKMLDEMSKSMTSNFELMLKTLSDGLKNIDVKREDGSDQVDPTHVENPKISQPDYISEYRSSLRKYSGISPFIGYETQLKGDNLGSYI